MFLFELFLPVVMLIFGLFFMLRLKFCIPPELTVAARLAAVGKFDPLPTLKADLMVDVNAMIDLEFADQSDMADALKTQFEPDAMADMEANVGVAAAAAAAASSGGTIPMPPGAPSVSAGLVWQTEVVHP
jgi:hypothetical protein